MKTLISILLLACTGTLSAQVVSGLYFGTLVNDSTKKEQRYELALSEYRGKITGYSYTTFVVNDTFYYGVKRIKAHRENGKLVVEDDKMIVNNFPESPAKGVKQINTITLTGEDTLRNVDGAWKTTRTKVYYSLSGDMDMRRNDDSSASALIGHLKELNIIRQPVYASSQKVQPTQEVKIKPGKIKIENKPVAPVENNAVSKAAPQVAVVIPYQQRAKKQLHALELSADSIVLSFYDNGVIDGDSISVYLNGEQIIANNRLTATATKKTVMLPAVENIELILVAENLGTLPPNTGLLVVKDGDKVYQVNFSADLQTNAAILFKRKLK